MQLAFAQASWEKTTCFNPLFIGSKDATPGRPRGRRWSARFNPLFIGSKDATPVGSIYYVVYAFGFNPLFIGSKDATFTYGAYVVMR